MRRQAHKRHVAGRKKPHARIALTPKKKVSRIVWDAKQKRYVKQDT